MMGDTGPCGPCSELHVDLTPAGDSRGSLVNAGDARCIEIWNLVFIQFNANPDGTFSPLPAQHVDTGMGFERVTSIIQGTKKFTDFSRPISNYETDIFRPLFDAIEKLSGKRYGGTLPGSQGSSLTRPAAFQPAETADGQDANPPSPAAQEQLDIAFRVIADHIRTLSFALADGIQPSNEGRGYVLRRILRRAVRYGRSLGLQEPFFFRLVDVVSLTMGGVFPELSVKESQIVETIKCEEESFNKTLDRGLELFERETEEATNISGAFAFRLYDEQGFPLDLTELMARERGLAVDTAGFEELMEEQRDRARKAQKKSVITIADAAAQKATNFLGYEHDHTGADVEEVVDLDGKTGVILNNSVLYAAMGGQVGDHGEIVGENGRWEVIDTRKSGAAFIHVLAGNGAPAIGKHVTVRIDRARRAAIERHHSATQLLHWALHESVSRDAVQKGSYVGPEKLTFDFTSAALTKPQVRAVEQLVNEKIAENSAVSWKEIPYPEAKQRSDIMQFFGDKYGDLVRVVQIGGAPNELNGYSMELCGGTHVRATGDIGPFRILGESAIAAGIRRIEAVAGAALDAWAVTEAAAQDAKFSGLTKRKSDLAPLPAFTGPAAINSRAAHLEKTEGELRAWEKENAKTAGAEIQKRAAALAQELAEANRAAKAVVTEVAGADGALLQAIVDALKTQFKGPIFLAGASDSRVDLVAAVPKEMTAQFQAGALIQQVAPIVGGKGGGRPDNARGAGKDPAKIGEALAQARALLLA
ncbi:MAG: alanine--tRNA ligase, partial [Chthoniobacterales bacterium]